MTEGSQKHRYWRGAEWFLKAVLFALMLVATVVGAEALDTYTSYDEDFTSTPDWTGGTHAGGEYNLSVGGTLTSPNLSISGSPWVNHTLEIYLPPLNETANYSIKPELDEGDYWPSIGEISPDQWCQFEIIQNRSSNKSDLSVSCDDGDSGSISGENFSNTGEDYFRMAYQGASTPIKIYFQSTSSGSSGGAWIVDQGTAAGTTDARIDNFTMNSQSLRLFDHTANNNDLLAYSATWNASGHFEYDGSNDFLAFTSNEFDINPGASTFAGWIRRDSGSIMLLGENGTTTHRSVEIDASNIVVEGDTNGNSCSAAHTFTAGTWYHVAITISAGTCAFYVDGSVISAADSSIGDDITLEHVGVGGNGALVYSSGAIDDLRIWDLALSAAEVNELASNRSAQCDNLTHWYPFEHTQQTCAASAGTLSMVKNEPSAPINATLWANITLNVTVTCSNGALGCGNVSVWGDPVDTVTYPYTSTDTVEGKTIQEWVDTFFDAIWADTVDSTFSSAGDMAVTMWFAGEDSNAASNLNSNCNWDASSMNITNHTICFVTDEHTNVQYVASMASNQTRYEMLHNFTTLLYHPSIGNLPCWEGGIAGLGTYDAYSDVCHAIDSASDADLRAAKAMRIACAKQTSGEWSVGTVDYCQDYMDLMARIFKYDLVSYNSEFFLCNGYNNAAGTCPESSQSLRPDYLEIGVLYDMCEFSGNTSYCTAADDILDWYNRSVGTNDIHQGKTMSFSGTTVSCNELCTPAYLDNTDTWRAFPALAEALTHHPQDVADGHENGFFNTWWNSWSGGAYTSTVALPIEIYANSSDGGVRQTQNSYKTTGMHLPLAVAMSSTWARAKIENALDEQWDAANSQPHDAGYAGAYYFTFFVRGFGTAAGLNDPQTYAQNKGLISTTVNDTPFFTTNSNPITKSDDSCLQNMVHGDSCTVVWNVTPTSTGTYAFFAFATSDLSGVERVDTSQVAVNVQPTCLDTITNYVGSQGDNLTSCNSSSAFYFDTAITADRADINAENVTLYNVSFTGTDAGLSCELTETISNTEGLKTINSSEFLTLYDYECTASSKTLQDLTLDTIQSGTSMYVDDPLTVSLINMTQSQIYMTAGSWSDSGASCTFDTFLHDTASSFISFANIESELQSVTVTNFACDAGSGGGGGNSGTNDPEIDTDTANSSVSTAAGFQQEITQICGVELKQPASLKIVQPVCTAGTLKSGMRVEVYNPFPDTHIYHVDISDVQCDPVESFSLLGKDRYSFTLDNCVCPDAKTVAKGSMVITDSRGDDCFTRVPIKLVGRSLSTGQIVGLFLGGLLIIGGLITFIILVFAIGGKK